MQFHFKNSDNTKQEFFLKRFNYVALPNTSYCRRVDEASGNIE